MTDWFMQAATRLIGEALAAGDGYAARDDLLLVDES
jgi:hypothetical protein